MTNGRYPFLGVVKVPDVLGEHHRHDSRLGPRRHLRIVYSKEAPTMCWVKFATLH